MDVKLKANVYGDMREHIIKSGFWLVNGVNIDEIKYLYENNTINVRHLELKKVAETYMGMGYSLGVYYDYLVGQFIIFLEGGSNSYDVVENAANYNNYMCNDTKTMRMTELNRYFGARHSLRDDIYNFFTKLCPHDINLLELKEWVIMTR